MLDQNLSKMLIIFQNESRKWGFPKGKMLDTEMACRDYFTCAKRELYEETGIMLNCNKYKKLGSVIIKNKLFYIVTLMKNIRNSYPVDTNEIGKIKWINVADLSTFILNHECNITIRNIHDYMVPPVTGGLPPMTPHLGAEYALPSSGYVFDQNTRAPESYFTQTGGYVGYSSTQMNPLKYQHPHRQPSRGAWSSGSWSSVL